MWNRFSKLFLSLFWVLIAVLSAYNQPNISDGYDLSLTLPVPKNGEIRYFKRSFKVPENTESISINYSYDKKGGKNRVELGVFDSQNEGGDSDKKGFRGWSGSVRDSVFLAKETATHGYVAGEIEPGTWWVILGLASYTDEAIGEGVAVTLRVDFNKIDEKARQQFEVESGRKFSFEKKEKFERVKGNGLTWFAGDLHAHTFHGDGSWSIKGILESATSNNLDFVAVTEHNTFSHHEEIETESKAYPDLLVIKGQEITTYGGHINAWGLPTGEWIDFRVLPNSTESAKQMAAEAKKLGAIVSINHPTMDCGGCNWTYGDWANMSSVEVWNATWDEQDESALRLWEEQLRKGTRITAVGSSDSHKRPEEPSDYPNNLAIGEPSVFIGAKSKTQEDLFEAIKAGRVFVAENSRRSIEFSLNDSAGIGDEITISKGDDMSLKFTLRGFPKGSVVKLISSGGVFFEKITTADTFSEVYRGEAIEKTYFRIEVRDQKGAMRAFTNPIYLEIGG